MEENRKRQSWSATALLVIAFAAYPASAGPAALALKHADYPARGEKLFCVVYGPLTFLPEPVVDGFEQWINWWMH
ncbi:MAG TPA: hypothetical protein VHC22_12560 [Pirellulales bacterium]|nr:hypothetical protein [Pirellulales bacterium]